MGGRARRVSGHCALRLVRGVDPRSGRHGRPRRVRAGALGRKMRAARRAATAISRDQRPRTRSPRSRRLRRPMQVDVLLDPFGARWSELRDTAHAAVDAGFAGIWTFDHLDGRVYRAPHVLECWTVLSAIAALVPGVTVGPLVLNVANRHPGLLAAMAATLQDVSNGCLLLGLGAGGGPETGYVREQEAI